MVLISRSTDSLMKGIRATPNNAEKRLQPISGIFVESVRFIAKKGQLKGSSQKIAQSQCSISNELRW